MASKSTIKVALVIIGIVSAILFLNHFKRPLRKYKVLVTFCDSRKPITVFTTTYQDISNRDISNNNVAVPEWGNYLNVCSLTVLESQIVEK